ncbi:hypothetical protein BGZ81_002368 [Podila clonocystis]|nr:hypothetical protein BGZ81_002368 [Podila clonocystis]
MDGARPGDRSIPKQPHSESIAAAASTSSTAPDSSGADASSQGRSTSATSATQNGTEATLALSEALNTNSTVTNLDLKNRGQRSPGTQDQLDSG